MSKLANNTILLALFFMSAVACGDSGDGDSGDGDSGEGGSELRDASDQQIPDASGAQVDAAGGSDAMATLDAGSADAGPLVTGVVLNEVLLDQQGGDSDEFAELKGEASTDYSNLSLLQIDGDNGDTLNPGLVLSVHAGCTTDANGYCEININANQFQNGTQTLLLVIGSATFLAADIDADDDGVIDNEPWDQLVDAVAIFDGVPSVDNTDHTYAGNSVLNKTFNGGNPMAFGGASRIPDGTDTDAAADWTSNTPSFNNSGIVTGEARNTPGAANSVEP